jgi:AcrR family transcriptional regulator
MQAALALIDRGEPESFTMRRLADAMGIAVMTLYGYVGSKEEILEGVTSVAFREVHRDPPADAPWEEQLRTDVRDLEGVCRRHPHLVTLVIFQSTVAPGLFRMRERMLETLHAAGFDSQTALRAIGVLCHYALGYAGARAGAGPIVLPDRIRELPRDEFPRLAEAADHYAEHLSDEAFEYGLTLILDGLAAQHPSPQADSSA